MNFSQLNWKETLKLTAFGLQKIPLIAFTLPRVIRMDEVETRIQIPLNWRTRNHLGSMYFGALSIGADLAGGLAAWRAIERSGKKIDLVFGSCHSTFHRRAESAVDFVCDQGIEISQFVQEVSQQAERQTRPVSIKALSVESQECVAEFELALSLKRRQ